MAMDRAGSTDEETPMSFAQFAEHLREQGIPEPEIDLFKRRMEEGRTGRGPEDGDGRSAMLDAPAEPLWEWDDEWIYRMVP